MLMNELLNESLFDLLSGSSQETNEEIGNFQ
jgi:hypothetical protein